MKPSKMDPVICVVALVVFLFCFFCIGRTTTYYKEGEVDNQHIIHRAGEIKSFSYPTIVYIGPPIILMFFMFWLFRRELRDVSIRNSIRKLKKKRWKRLHFK